ncbi:MAG: hypothetical protein ABSF85_04160 [Terriglobales bacterium]
MRSKLMCVLVTMKMSRALLVAMVLLCSTLGLAQGGGFSGNNEVQSLALTGGIMTGPIVGDARFTDPVEGPSTGGLLLTDDNGNSIGIGKAAGSHFVSINTGDGVYSLTMRGGSNPGMQIFNSNTNGFIQLNEHGIALYAGGSDLSNSISLGLPGGEVGLKVFAKNADAVAGGLVAGNLYRTGTDPDVVCVVH